ncbi:PstS family phosphate ABC transporter substrate-binding protein [Leptothermofonsia sichuanensis E412]|uniref:PstS family phosphate ABC transporter substrate-binding protein n=1 Tax=Leptothermofonsia sichuanensis TaxID=2917832 RepID=UPI001CA72396|nr:PstS family phosphate ABC transporter substrate-binding protein [Leptothermofonsia sichuanensis]QZZ21250.1 PstS family phosphate ABC transporter substrate-binding protein [Leptothermofonsia sichuanensis E412]
MVVETKAKTKAKLSIGLSSVVVIGLTLSACGEQQQASPDATAEDAEVIEVSAPTAAGIQVDGSSTVYPITDLVAKEFRKTPEGEKVQISVQFSGTSAGFRKFCAAETDISDASRPILLKEIEACNKAGVRFIELPVAFDALTLAVNPNNTWAKDITIAELRKVWEPAAEGKITNWNQIRSSYPSRPLSLFGAGKDSGTFDYFNEVTTGDPKASRKDYTGSEDDNELVIGIEKDPNALGYIPYAYFEPNQNRLKVLAIDNGRGPVLPTRETVENATYQPFSRPLFIYVNAKSAQEKPEVKAFVEYYLKNAKNLVPSVGYVPLPDEGYHVAKIQFTRGEIGTVFEGVPQPNVTIAELLRRQAVFQLSTKN